MEGQQKKLLLRSRGDKMQAGTARLWRKVQREIGKRRMEQGMICRQPSGVLWINGKDLENVLDNYPFLCYN
jgi:hypothetical protein